MLQVGSLIDNKYKILSEVGHGGMSVVYLAINERANKTWAVKEIRKDGVCDFEAVKQGLVVETDMLKRLNHPHLPSIIDVIDAEDSFLIVMDYIEGKSLQKVIKNSGAQPQDLVIKWAMQLCDVLGYLHKQDPPIIYRDMKPANVMLKPSGDITLIDFGTAREFKNRAMVEDTTCLGTRGYAAPEQFGGRGQTDPRTDIYCLGATLYHLITGHSPAEPPYEIKPLSYWDPSFYGTGIELIINKCCQQDPEARYQDCAELMYDLEHVHEMDMGTQRKRKQKWAAFVASITMFAVGVAGMIGFGLAKNAAKKDSYDYYISKAQTTSVTDFKNFTANINEAISIDPGRYEAYETMLDRIEADAYLNTTTEWGALKACLEDKTKDVVNEEYLLAENPDKYADIQFRVGKLLFLMCDGTNSNLRDSAVYFGKALDRGEMASSSDEKLARQASLAASLQTIGKSIDQLDSTLSVYDDKAYDRSQLWADLSALIENYPIDSLGKQIYGISLYNRVAFIVGDQAEQFNNNGVSFEDMLAVLNTIKTALTDTQSHMESSAYATFIDNALHTTTSAQDKINGMRDKTSAVEGGVS